MALPRITQKEMTEREQRELKTLLDRARIAHGRVLTNSETNSIKKEYIDKLMVEREAEAKKARQLKKKQAYKPDPEASFSWSANTARQALMNNQRLRFSLVCVDTIFPSPSPRRGEGTVRALFGRFHQSEALISAPSFFAPAR